MARKPVPIATSELLYHPESDAGHVHFEGAAIHPFRSEAADFDRANAWWLSEAALLAYWEPIGSASNPGARERIERPGTGLSFEAFFDRNGTQCYVMSGETFAIVSFRGTQAESWTDRITGLKFWPRPWSGPGRVHRGFRAALMWVWPDLERFLARFRGAGRIRRSVWFTGHSLGGALATLAAHLFDDAQGVYTIGSPCVGDATFAAAFAAKMERRSIRYTHGRDTVTVLPPEHLLGYRHVGTHKHIIEDGRVVDVPPSGLTAAHRPTSLWRTCSARWRRGARGVGLIPWFADHTPKIYATHIWNDLDAQG